MCTEKSKSEKNIFYLFIFLIFHLKHYIVLIILSLLSPLRSSYRIHLPISQTKIYEKWLVLQGNQAYNVNFGHACNTTTIPMIVPEGNVVVRWSQGIHLYTARLSEPSPRVLALRSTQCAPPCFGKS